jgi:hypothetical protein
VMWSSFAPAFSLVVVPVDEWNIAVCCEDFLGSFEEGDPSFLIAVCAESGCHAHERTRLLAVYLHAPEMPAPRASTCRVLRRSKVPTRQTRGSRWQG